jgi:phosphopantetheinyl transferase
MNDGLGEAQRCQPSNYWLRTRWIVKLDEQITESAQYSVWCRRESVILSALNVDLTNIDGLAIGEVHFTQIRNSCRSNSDGRFLVFANVVKNALACVSSAQLAIHDRIGGQT